MKKRTKVLLLLLSAVLLVVASVMGTLAYLTSKDTVTNTFTVGKVAIVLDEAVVNLYGKPVDDNGNVIAVDVAKRTGSNAYKLIPGHEYTKDPTVHVANDSESSYIFVKVENDIFPIEADADTEYKKIATQITDNGWTSLIGVQDVYWREWTRNEDNLTETTSLQVFSKFKIKGVNVKDADLKGYADKKITITAYAIQKDSFDEALAAWNALQTQLNNGS